MNLEKNMRNIFVHAISAATVKALIIKSPQNFLSSSEQTN